MRSHHSVLAFEAHFYVTMRNYIVLDKIAEQCGKKKKNALKMFHVKNVIFLQTEDKTTPCCVCGIVH